MTDKIYQSLAKAFVAEGVEVCFSLMGDGNMHFATALAQHEIIRSYFVRHEHCACTMAAAYSRATGGVGVASITCGPGVTQVITALAGATRAGIPMVVFAGESPIDAAWYGQGIEQAPLITATGAHYIQCHSPKLMLTHVRDAFFIAKTQKRPVVLGIPLDLQQLAYDYGTDYLPSDEFVPKTGRTPPDPDIADAVAARIAIARRIVVLGGRGAGLSDALAECVELAEATGSLLATTLPARGLFHDQPFLLGVAGGYAGALTREMMAQADMVIAIGASLTSYTNDGGKLYPNACVIQIDEAPVGLKHAQKTADLYLRADAKAGVRAILDRLPSRTTGTDAWRSPALVRRIAEEPADSFDFQIEPATMDPRTAVAVLDSILPKHWVMVNGTGHSAHFTVHMRGRSAANFITIREFGAIGNALSHAIGVAAARPNDTIVMIDGDGSFLMHVQELETIRRYNLRILICVLNDGAYGPEIHRLRAQGLNDGGAVFGRGDLGKLGEGFGIRGRVVTAVEQIEQLFEAFEQVEGPEIWDIHISDQVISPMTRRSIAKGSH